jgi:hypothetical protein
VSETTQVLPSHLHMQVGGTLAVVVVALVAAAIVARMLTSHVMGLVQGFVLLVIVGVIIGLMVRWIIPQVITDTVVSLIGRFALWPHDIAARWKSSSGLGFVWCCFELAVCVAFDCAALWYGSLWLTRNRYSAAITLVLGAAFCTVGFVLGLVTA